MRDLFVIYLTVCNIWNATRSTIPGILRESVHLGLIGGVRNAWYWFPKVMWVNWRTALELARLGQLLQHAEIKFHDGDESTMEIHDVDKEGEQRCRCQRDL